MRLEDEEMESFLKSLTFSEDVVVIDPASLTIENVLTAMDRAGRQHTFPCQECGWDGLAFRLMETDETVLYRERCGCGERHKRYSKP